MIFVNIMISSKFNGTANIEIVSIRLADIRKFHKPYNFCNNGNNITTTIPYTTKLSRGKTFMISYKTKLLLAGKFLWFTCHHIFATISTKAYPGKHLWLSKNQQKPQKFCRIWYFGTKNVFDINYRGT